MTIKNIEIQDEKGNIHYPHTSADVVWIGGVNVKDTLDEDMEVLGKLSYLGNYKKLANENSDYERITRALNNIDNGVLNLEKRIYNLNGKDVIIKKPITINGNFATFKNGGILFESGDVHVINLNIDCPELDNGFQANTKSVKNIVIENCNAIAKEHCYLFESYNGNVSDITVTNCTSKNSIHGFISKATNVSFINCKASNHLSFGYAFISDNIGTNMAKCYNNSIVNCYAELCYNAFIAYSRDKTSKKECRNAFGSINGLNSISCTTVLTLGEIDVPTGYLSISSLEKYIISNITSEGSGSEIDIEIKRMENSLFSNIGKHNKYYLDKDNNDIITTSNFLKAIERSDYEDIVNIANSQRIDLTFNRLFDVSGGQGSIVTDKKIDVEGTYTKGTEFTIILRGGGGDLTYGGYSNKFALPSGIKTTLLYNEVQVTKWVFSGITNKFICTSLMNTSYL